MSDASVNHGLPEPPARVAVRSPRVIANLEARSTPSLDASRVAARDLARYYRLLATELRAMTLTDGEAHLIVAAVVALRTAQAEGRHLASLADAVEAEYAQHVGGSILHHTPVDGDALVARLGALSRTATVALIDAGERALVLRRRKGPEYRHGRESWLLRVVGLVRDG